MRYLTLGEVVGLHRRVLAQSGGSPGIRDLGLLESVLAQPKADSATTWPSGSVSTCDRADSRFSAV
jgi:prophage maintenance system killer protein